jgi:hypothetical protein
VSGLLEPLARAGAFRPGLRLDELAAVHIPFREFGLEAEPERMIAEGIAQHTGVTLVVGERGNGKSSALAYVAGRLASAPGEDGRRYLPLFVPVASRGRGGRRPTHVRRDGDRERRRGHDAGGHLGAYRQYPHRAHTRA